jgi:hypothetical protein
MEIPIWVVICVGIAALVSLSFAVFTLLLPTPKTGGVVTPVTTIEIIPLVKERLVVLANTGVFGAAPNDAPEFTLENMSRDTTVALFLDTALQSLWEYINTVDCGETHDPAATKPKLCANSIRAYRMLPKCKRAEIVDAVMVSKIAEMSKNAQANENVDVTIGDKSVSSVSPGHSGTAVALDCADQYVLDSIAEWYKDNADFAVVDGLSPATYMDIRHYTKVSGQNKCLVEYSVPTYPQPTTYKGEFAFRRNVHNDTTKNPWVVTGMGNQWLVAANGTIAS